MSRLLSMIALLTLAIPARADEPKPNTLTDKEIADGWLLLFDGETAFGWKPVDAKDGAKPKIEVKDAALTVAGKGSGTCFSTRFQCFEMTGEYRSTADSNQLSVGMIQSGNTANITIGDSLRTSAQNQWRALVVRVTPQDTEIRAGEPGKSGFTATGKALGNNLLWELGFKLSSEADARIELRNLKLRPLEEKPLFDGKTLDGWSVNQADPKRISSKWKVTDVGEISLKNGPGDLVTGKQFDNFVLQLECKTLSPAANSGVFFRCIPGQYQNGYEAQVQNSFKEGDRSKPLDFGTGAIYRRIPARKVVSNDKEWFTMTVVAEGRHIATWVNGYQTVDWTDDRQPDDNPRKGYRAGKGPISLQGHDPTTDILFRNIRIAELPAGK